MNNSNETIRTLYHGSPTIVKVPSFGFGKEANDYGQGFYCTPNSDLGKEWATKSNQNGFLNKYTLDVRGLKVLNLEDSCYSILTWVTILLKYRSFSLKYVESQQAKQYLLDHFSIQNEDSFDIITGYRADDSYFMYAEDFLNGDLSYENLKNSILLGGLGTQVMIKSQVAFTKIKFLEATPVSKNDWYQHYQERDTKARSDYRKLGRTRNRNVFNIDQIVEEEVRQNDPRLF